MDVIVQKVTAVKKILNRSLDFTDFYTDAIFIITSVHFYVQLEIPIKYILNVSFDKNRVTSTNRVDSDEIGQKLV